MSVYTTVEHNELVSFLCHYSLGELVSYEGISAGIENTNYFVTTTCGQYVLTLFESLHADELPYFLDLMAHLAEHNVPSAHPEADDTGQYLRTLKGKPAALVARLAGRSTESPSTVQCAALGHALGHLHVVGREFKGTRENGRGPHWWHVTMQKVLPKLAPEQARLLTDELVFQKTHRLDTLPRGVIHADLFRDNALFDGDQLTGIIDFYYACNDVLLYDVAVTVNDWCCNADGSLDEPRVEAFLSAYRKERQFTQEEKQAWPLMLRAGALRFWLSRLLDLHFPRDGEITHTHDPEMFRQILQKRIEQKNDLILQ